MINKKLNTYFKFLRETVSTENLTVYSVFGTTKYQIRYNQDKNDIIYNMYLGDTKIVLSIIINGSTECKIELKYNAMLNLNLLLLLRKN